MEQEMMKTRIPRRILSFFLCLALFAGICPVKAEAAPVPWADDISISAEGGIVMDAESGAILYGKNIHQPYYPASITKIMTALLIIENFDLDDTVTFSHNAVFNVETGSSSAGLDEGDTLTVRDCLYAMLLKSANEAANALAEYASGSIEAFAAVMNARARALGCTDTHFNNPSGLNDPMHYTSAHDMALIAQAAFRNEIFVEIDSSLYHDLPPTKRNPDGLRVYPGHRMMKKNDYRYYSGIIGGKTGYTSLAGNTLVTCAERDGRKLIAVVLNGHQTHYVDTKALLDFGFRNFQSLNVADYDTTYTSISNDMTIAGLPTADLSVLHVQDDCHITLPKGADFSDAVSTISYELPDNAPEDAIARISYEYDGRQVGFTYLMRNRAGSEDLEPAAEAAADPAAFSAPAGLSAQAESIPASGESETVPESEIAHMAGGLASPLSGIGSSQKEKAESDGAPAPEDPSASTARSAPADSSAPAAHTAPASKKAPSALSRLPLVLGVILCLAGLAGGLLYFKQWRTQKEEAERAARYERRQKRLEDMGVSTAEFDQMVNERRANALASPKKKPRRRNKNRKSFLDHKTWR